MLDCIRTEQEGGRCKARLNINVDYQLAVGHVADESRDKIDGLVGSVVVYTRYRRPDKEIS